MSGRFQVATVFKGVDQMTGTMAKIVAKNAAMTRSIGKSFDGLSRTVSSFGSTLKNIGTTVAVAGVAVGGGLLFAGKAGADFEEAIAAVGAVGLQARDQIADLEKKALELGSTTKFTATQAAGAMEMMRRQGFSSAEVLAGVGGVLDAAAASGLEMAEVANVVGNSIKAFGLKASEATYVADLFTVASAKTNSTIGSLGESMKNLAPVALSFGVSIKDATAMVALLQDVGLDASEAGTATATMLTKLSKPADEVAAKMKQMGISFKDASGNMKAPAVIFEEMRLASAKLGGNMDQVAFFADLVGLRGQKAALNLQRLFNSDAGKNLLESLTDVNGKAKEMAALRMQNLKGDLTILQSTVEGLQVALFNTESGPLRDMVQGVTEFIGTNTDGIVKGFQRFMEIAKPLAKIFSDSFLQTVRTIGDAFSDLIPAGGDSKEWVTTLTKLATNLGQIAGFAVTAAAGFVAVAGGVAMLGSVVVDTLKGAFDGLVAFFGERVFAITDWFANLGAMFNAEGPGFFSKAWDIGKHIVSGLVGGIKSMLTAPFDLMQSIGKGALAGLKSALGIQSPSREMAKLGAFTSEGLERGLLGGLPGVAGAWGRLTEFPELRLPEPIWTDSRGTEAGTAPMVTPQERMAHTISETNSTTRTEVTLKAEPGTQAKQTGGARRAPGLKLQPTGGF